MIKILRKYLTIFALIFIGMSAPVWAQTKSKLNQILERGTLRVGTTGDFNPMSIKDTTTNTLVGFDIDAMNQLAADMGVKVEYVTTEWATLVNGIVSDRYDIFAGGSSLNMARAKTVAFTSPYVYAGTVPLINKKDAKKFVSWESINNSNVNVAVLMGTVFEQQAKALFPKAKVRSVEKPATGLFEPASFFLCMTLPSLLSRSSLGRIRGELTRPPPPLSGSDRLVLGPIPVFFHSLFCPDLTD